MKYVFIFFALSTITFSGCKKNEEAAKLGELTLEATGSTNGSGLVTFTAHAENAVAYTYYFGEGLDEPITSVDGNTTHQYLSSDTYPVKVVASSSALENKNKTSDLVVTVDEAPVPPAGYSTPTSYAGMNLVWQDEFNGDALNTDSWNYDLGPYNDELQYYQQKNTSVLDGYLIIKAKVQKVGQKIYTSSRITTAGKRAFTFGRVDIRALMPKGQGMFPALWMLGSTFNTLGWPKCGEIDIMETIGGGGRDSVCYGTAHWDFNGHVSYGGKRGLHDGSVLGDAFHVYSIIWDVNQIRWYIDDVLYHTIDLSPADLTELKLQFYFLFDLAIGGSWAGPPDATTVFPQRMVVDYIRVFQPQ